MVKYVYRDPNRYSVINRHSSVLVLVQPLVKPSRTCSSSSVGPSSSRVNRKALLAQK